MIGSAFFVTALFPFPFKKYFQSDTNFFFKLRIDHNKFGSYNIAI